MAKKFGKFTNNYNVQNNKMFEKGELVIMTEGWVK